MNPLRIGILASRGAAGIGSLLEDPERSAVWDAAVVVASEKSLADEEAIHAAQVPLDVRPIRQHPSFRNLRSREDYDAEVAGIFEARRVDVVLLAKHDFVVTAALLDRFPGRVYAIHDADLTLRKAGRLYAGPHAVLDAILNGEQETRSSIYQVTPEVGRGPLLLLGAPYPVAPMAMDARARGDAAFLTRYAALHRQWMVETSWGAMLTRAVHLLAAGATQTVGDVVWIDGAPGPCMFGESPRSCHDPAAMVTRGIPASCPFIAG